MKDLGGARKILGMVIVRDKKNGRLGLTQRQYLEKVVTMFEMENSKLTSSPLTPHFKLSTTMAPNSEEEIEYMEQVSYLSAVGSLMYAMDCTLSDNAQAVSMVSRYMANPGK